MLPFLLYLVSTAFPLHCSYHLTLHNLRLQHLKISTSAPSHRPSSLILLILGTTASIAQFLMPSFSSLVTSIPTLVLPPHLSLSAVKPGHTLHICDIIESHCPNLICLTETWIKPDITAARLADITPNGYSLFSFPTTVSDLRSSVSHNLGVALPFLLKNLS